MNTPREVLHIKDIVNPYVRSNIAWWCNTYRTPYFTPADSDHEMRAVKDGAMSGEVIVDGDLAGCWFIRGDNELGLVVAPPYRGMGIGQFMLLMAQLYMKGEVEFLWATVHPENTRSQALFRKMWKDTGRMEHGQNRFEYRWKEVGK